MAANVAASVKLMVVKWWGGERASNSEVGNGESLRQKERGGGQ